jgi:hypothetical protein
VLLLRQTQCWHCLQALRQLLWTLLGTSSCLLLQETSRSSPQETFQLLLEPETCLLLLLQRRCPLQAGPLLTPRA